MAEKKLYIASVLIESDLSPRVIRLNLMADIGLPGVKEVAVMEAYTQQNQQNQHNWVMDNDGQDLLCMKCGLVHKRTRGEVYPPETECRPKEKRNDQRRREMTKEEASKDPRVQAIRADKLVGRGTCSVIDECLSDTELVERLNEELITDPSQAIQEARDQQELYLEQALNARWGEDDDPQLIEWREWKKARDKEEGREPETTDEVI